MRNRFLVLLLFCVVLGVTVCSPVLLRKIGHLYQYSYWCWNVGYEGLGEESIVYRLEKGRRILCDREAYSPSVEQVLLDLPGYLKREGKILQSHPRSRTTYLLEIEGRKYVVKESFKKPRVYSLLFPSRYSRIAWNNAIMARRLGFEVFHPVALVEVGSFLKFSSYLVYPFVGETLAEHKCEEDWRVKLEATISHQKALGLVHPDFRPTNVLLLEDGSIQYIDIDEMHRYPPLSYAFHARLKKEGLRFAQIMQESKKNN